MPRSRLEAKYPRVDGASTVKVEVGYEFDHDEAALVLAKVYEDLPVQRRPDVLRAGLLKAGQERVLQQRPQPPEQAVEAYRKMLRDLKVFPQEEERQAMLARLRDAQEVRRNATAAVGGRVAGLPILWAKTEREKDGHPVVRVEEPRYFALDQAATALAIVYRQDVLPWASDEKLRAGLRAATRRRLLKGSAAKKQAEGADPRLVDGYRRVLIQEGVFTE